jgi:glutamate racemase
MVEDGVLAGPELDARMAEYVAPLRAADVDTVVLGCTHYVFVRDAIQKALPGVKLLDSSAAIARRTRQILEEANALAPAGPGSVRIHTTADPAGAERIVHRLWGEPEAVQRVEI